MRKSLVHFKHKSMRDYWDGKNYTINKIVIEVNDNDTLEDIEMRADYKILDIMELFYPSNSSGGDDSLYRYTITNIEKIKGAK